MSYSISVEPSPRTKGPAFEWDGLTWNLRDMMIEALGPEGIRGLDGKKAKDVIPALKRALADMRDRPDHYRKFDSPNGWGKFDGDIPEVSIPYLFEKFLQACRRMPNGIVRVQ